MRTFAYVVAGIVAGIACGYLAMFLAMGVVAPLMGNTDEMSSGLIGTFTAVFAIPLLAIAGGFSGYWLAANRPGRSELDSV